MNDHQANSPRRYIPEPIYPPAPFAWPPRPLAALRWLSFGMFWPWPFLYIGLAFVSWEFLTPDMAQMKNLQPGWIAQVWLRNAVLLTLVAGGLHWWLYIRRSQQKETKFNAGWQAVGDDKFLWKDQVKDNMFWSLASGVTIWSGYECLTWWWYASGYVVYPTISEAPVYFLLMIWGVFFWSTAHFYFVHRLMHFQPIYRVVHELHHRNTNTGPWTGISMHPYEHLLYFSLLMLWWVVPVHPVIILLNGFFQGISPAVSHSGFDYLKVGRSLRIPVGDNFHNLHHRFFHINYGNTTTPFDRLFNSWHDGSESGKALLRRRLRNNV